jgi:putative mRNA 3-end processing factor
MEAEIDRGGAILLGKNTVCDSHADRPLRVVTHAHTDHMLGLEESLEKCDLVLATTATMELIGVLRGSLADRVRAIEYYRSLKFGDEVVTLFPAGHIIGSSQVLVKDSTGRRIVYTGDHKLPEAKVLRADVLVMEATYGNPAHVRPFKDSVARELIELVERSLKVGPVYIFGYHGKLQETVGILREAGIDTPVVMPERVYRIAEICRAHGIRMGECHLSKSEEARSILRRGEPFIGLYHMRSKQYVGHDATRIYLSGWEFLLPVRQLSDRDYAVALSDHSDFEQLLEYVEKSGPELVITDDYRVGNAKSLAREVAERLGIRAIAMP